MTDRSFPHSETHLLHELVIRMDRIARRTVLKNEDLTYAEFLILLAVAEVELPIQEALGEHLDLSRSQVSQRVASLREKGFVTQTIRPENRRQTLVALTPRGGEVLQRCGAALSESSARLWARLGERRAAFKQDLEILVEALRAAENRGSEAPQT